MTTFVIDIILAGVYFCRAYYVHEEHAGRAVFYIFIACFAFVFAIFALLTSII